MGFCKIMRPRVCFEYVPRENNFYESYKIRKEMSSIPVSEKVNYAKSDGEFIEELVDGGDRMVEGLWNEAIRADCSTRKFKASPTEN